MSFTPGPWVVEPAAVGTVETESGIAIAQAFQVKPLRQDLKQKERQANARLIAAAPDLLQMVKRLMAVIDDGISDPVDIDIYQQAKALLVKLEGGAA